MKKIFNAKLTELEYMIRFIKNFIAKNIKAKNLLFDDETITKTHVVCEEVLMNIINYAYQPLNNSKLNKSEIKTPQQPLKIEIKVNDENSLFLSFIDMGVLFDPKKYFETNKKKSQEKIGGLGIKFIFEFSHKVKYKRWGLKNILKIIIKKNK